MRRLWCLLAIAITASACGGGQRTTRVVRSASEEHDVAAIGDASLMMVPRESEGRTWVSLWIDAGSRDADPPAIATVSAWAATHGGNVEASVLPDGTELRASCESERVDVCIDALVDVLGTREIDPEALGASMARLRSTRRGARADATRTADRMAIAALLGGDARGLDPLGDATDDAVIDVGRAQAFLAAHWGPSRALFVVIGDADEGRARSAIGDAIARVPSALGLRSAPTIEPAVGALVEVGDARAASVAVAVESGAAGIAIGRRAVAELEDGSASVFALRGADLVVVRGRDPEQVAAAVSNALALAAEVGGETSALAEDDPRSMARRIGARWVARAEERRAGGLGLGVVVAGGRGDADAEDPDEAIRHDAQLRASGIAEIADLAARHGAFDGDADDDSASLRWADGPRVRARRDASGRVAIAVSIAGGTEGEPARVHGRSALLARLLARCAARDSASWWVDARSIGVVVETAPSGAIDMIEQVTRCVRRLPMSAGAIEEVRASAIAELDRDDARLAHAARALAPGGPGAIATRGQAATIAAVEPRSLQRAWRAMATRGGTTIGIVGEMSAVRAARVAMLGLAQLPVAAVSTSTPGTVAIATEEITPVLATDETIEAVLALRDPRPRGRGAEAGARAVLDTMVDAIDSPSMRVVWARAGAGPEGAWLAIAVRADEDALATAPARIAAARARAREGIDRAVSSALEAAREARAQRSATTVEAARRLAWERDGDAPESAASADAARALLDAPLRWVIARPAPDARR